MAALEEAMSSQVKMPETCPNSNYKDKYSHLIGTSAAKDAAHTLEANRTYGCGECRGTLRFPTRSSGADLDDSSPSSGGQQAGHSFHRGGHE